MSDDRVQQVIEALDPQPASEVDWPVSRRQALRALAAAGLLGAGSGSASAESVGGVIADEAVFSNYDSESVSDGWELTIDDDVFALTESERTIGLPDGGVGEEVVLPNGDAASEVIAPDGSVVFEGDEIPDRAVAHYDATQLGLSDDDSVITWTDDSGEGHDLTAGDAPTYKTNVLNGNPVVRFDGNENYLDVTFGSSLSQPNVIFTVAQATSSPDGFIYDGIDGSNRHWLRAAANNWGHGAGSEDQGSEHDQDPHIFTSILDGSDGQLRLDGSVDTSGDVGADDLTGLTAGADNSTDSNGAFDVGEILVVDEGLTSTEIENEEQRLSDKWGITI